MRNEPNFEIFQQAFSLRVKIAAVIREALKAAPDQLLLLKEACTDLGMVLSEITDGDVEDEYRAYHFGASIFASLAEWKMAILNAEPDAQRFLNSAKLQVMETEAVSSFVNNKRLIEFVAKVENLQNVGDLVGLQEQLDSWKLPLLLYANIPAHRYYGLPVPAVENGVNDDESANLETTVAFLKFDIDGKPAKQCNYLKPGTAYDLTIEVRVSNWPESANFLLLMPVTIDARERGWLPEFKFKRPEKDGPFILTKTDRAVLEVAHSFGSRPYEFLYAAEFDDTSNCRNIAIIGHRRLLLEGTDIASNPISGFSHVDRHLLNIRNQLRSFPGIHSNDIANTMIALGGLGNIAALALRGGIFEAGTSEKQFQSKVSEMLRNMKDIGEHLQGHPESAGGITDLTFQDIPVELKVENSKVLFPKDFSKFFDQTAAYAIGLGKRIGVLCVLESSPKLAPVGIVEDDIDVFTHEANRSPILIVVVVIRGGLPKPSSYSR